jgi:hypothetical protein
MVPHPQTLAVSGIALHFDRKFLRSLSRAGLRRLMTSMRFQQGALRAFVANAERADQALDRNSPLHWHYRAVGHFDPVADDT